MGPEAGVSAGVGVRGHGVSAVKACLGEVGGLRVSLYCWAYQ